MNRIGILLVLAAVLVWAARAQEPEKEDLQFLIIEALTHNPQIAADAYRMRVFENRIQPAGALDDPELTVRWMEIPNTQFNRAVYGDFELMQRFRFPTKLSTQREIAAVVAEHAHHDHLERILDVVSQLKAMYAMLWFARTALVLNKENQQFLGQLLEAATTQYAVGKTSQQDVLKTSIELSKLRTTEESLRQEIKSAESMMRAILNRPGNAVVGPIDSLQTAPVPYTATRLVAFAFANRPMLVHDSLSVLESDLRLTLQNQEYIPDFKVGVEYVTYPSMAGIVPNRWTLTAGITIPFAPWTLSKASARVQEAEVERSMRQSMYAGSRRMLEAEIMDKFSKLKALEAEIHSYETTVVPQTLQSLRGLLTEYQTGKASFLMLLDSYRMYQMTKEELAMARMKHVQSLAALERAVGVTDITIIPGEEEQP